MSDLTSCVYEIAAEVRVFLEPLFQETNSSSNNLPDSAGHCFRSADLLAYVLNERLPDYSWISGEGVYGDESVRARINAGELTSWSAIEDAGQMHGWVISTNGEQLIVDITADQFGLDPVKVLPIKSREADGWLHRYFPSPDAGVAGCDWISKWRSERLLMTTTVDDAGTLHASQHRTPGF